MATITLGSAPDRLRVILNAGAPFSARVTMRDSAGEPVLLGDVALRLTLGGLVVSSSQDVDGAYAFALSAEQTATVSSGERARLDFVQADDVSPFAVGSVTVLS